MAMNFLKYLQALATFDARNVQPVDADLVLHTSLAMPASGITTTSTNVIDLGDDIAMFNEPVSIFIDIPSGSEVVSGGVLRIIVQSASSATAATSVYDGHAADAAGFGGRLYEKTFGELKVASSIYAVGAKRLQLPLAGVERFVRLQYAAEGATAAGATFTSAWVGPRL
jgi:hypothetical protein